MLQVKNILRECEYVGNLLCEHYIFVAPQYQLHTWAIFFTGLGMAIATSSEVLSSYGVLCVLLSSVASSLRWVLMQVLALRDVKSNNVMVTLYRFSPYSALSIIPFALLLEVPVLVKSPFAAHGSLLAEAFLYAVGGGVVSFLLIIVEILLLRTTSSLTMCVIGELKEIIQIVAAMLLYKDNINIRSGVGIAISIAAAYCYRHVMNEREDDDGDRDATLQILHSSQLAHKGMHSLGMLRHTNPDGHVTARYHATPTTESNDGDLSDQDYEELMFSTDDDEEGEYGNGSRRKLLREQEMVALDFSTVNPLSNVKDNGIHSNGSQNSNANYNSNASSTFHNSKNTSNSIHTVMRQTAEVGITMQERSNSANNSMNTVGRSVGIPTNNGAGKRNRSTSPNK